MTQSATPDDDLLPDDGLAALSAARRLAAARKGQLCIHTVQTGTDASGTAFLQTLSQVTPCGSFRNAVNAGVPILPACPGVSGMAETGDRLRVDFRTGNFRNLTRGTETRFEPLPDSLLETIALGGWFSHS